MTTEGQATTRPENLTAAEREVDVATERLNAAWRRIDEMGARRAALTALIANLHDDDDQVETLRRERRDLAGELQQAPHDAVALAEVVATSLQQWAAQARHWADREVAAAQTARLEPARRARAARAVIAPDRPVQDRSAADAEAAARTELDALAEPLGALDERIRAAREYAATAAARVASRFGDGSQSAEAVPRWLADVRRRAQERAGA